MTSAVQFQIGCQFDYELCPHLRTPGAFEIFIDGWRAAQVFFASLDIILQSER